ncbi:MAG: erythromycin esterase family protein [Pseudomonadota bacterium]|uniref:Erythromycin esterase homolog n=1 Tax=hydrothermal vent metagenome TaxID=652676 RepID=A0A161K0R4_9ZZZZ
MIVARFLLLAASMLPASTQAPALTQPGTDTGAAAFVEWAREHAVALPLCTEQSDPNSLRKASSIIGDARVVALGEPAHGAHEPLAFRNCLFRYLVERHGFTAIAIESGLNESRRLQDYLAGGQGDPRQLARDSLSWGFGRFAENVDLIAWIHRYNADRAHGRKVRLYGIDMSGGERSGEWRNARITLDDRIRYLAATAPGRSKHIVVAIDPFLDHFTLSGYAALPAASRTRFRSALAALVRFFDRERTRLIAVSGEEDFAWAKRNAILAGQVEAMFRVSRPASSDDTLLPGDYKSDGVRDSAMADNVRWVLEREGASGRVMLFAHNGHIVNAPLRGGIWSIYAHSPVAMGQHLRGFLHDRLRIIPTVAAANGPGLPPGDGPAGTIDRALAGTGLEHFLLDIRTVRAPVPAEWLARDQSMRVNFMSELALSPRPAFDAVAFFARLTPRAMVDAR